MRGYFLRDVFYATTAQWVFVVNQLCAPFNKVDTMKFTELGLAEPILRAVAEQGYDTPTPIQAQAIPQVLAGGDLLAAAQTGTGKTAGFTLPILQRLMNTPNQKHPRVLGLTPTRELAAQVGESVENYSKYLKLKSMVMFGGVNINPQTDKLRRGVDILVATPGRLMDHHGQGHIDLSHVEILVLDEADRMLDMGFIHDIKRIFKLLPKQRQNLLFSATFSDEIRTLAQGLLHEPKTIEVERRNSTVEIIEQTIYTVDRERKRELLTHLIKAQNWFQVLVFTRTKHGANRLAEQLDKDGISAMAIHGNKSQGARTRALSEFKDGKLQVLVATDIAARGIDIDQLPYVVNYELPQVAEDYVHRIGRTGRAGATGLAVSLVCVDEFKLLKDIERLTHKTFTRFAVKGFEPDLTVKPEPIQKPRTGGGHRSGGGGARTGSAKTASPQNRTNRSQGSATHGAKKPASGSKPPMHRTGGRGQ